MTSNNTALMAQAATLGMTLASLVSLLYLYRCFIIRKKEVWREVRISKYNEEETTKTIIKSILIVAIPVALSSLFAGTNKTIDALTIIRILKKYTTELQATIQYGILTGKVETLISLPFSFNIAFATALIPAISSSIAIGDKKTVERKVNFSMIMTLLIGIICTLLIAIFSKQIIRNSFP